MGLLKPLSTCTQVEESYIGADQFCRLVGQDTKAVLGNELALLEGLQFELIVHTPRRAIDGLMAVRA